MKYEMFIKIFGIKILKEECQDYINRRPLRLYGNKQFIIEMPVGTDNQCTLLQFLEDKYKLILIQKTTTQFIMRFKNNNKGENFSGANKTFNCYDLNDDTVIVEKTNKNLNIVINRNRVIIEKVTKENPHEVIKRKEIYYKDIKKYE